MKICICSSFRNSAGYLRRYFAQMGDLCDLMAWRGHKLYLVLAEGDSTDDTAELLPQYATGFAGEIVTCNHGGPEYGSVIDAQRFRQLAMVANVMWARIPEDTDVVLHLSSDLLWNGATLVALVDRLQEYPAVAPRVMHRSNCELYTMLGPHWYDTWAFRRNGVHFTNEPPYHADINSLPRGDRGGAMLQLDSAGGCLAIRGDLASGLIFRDDDLIVGICEQIYQCGGSVWLDPSLAVYHP